MPCQANLAHTNTVLFNQLTNDILASGPVYTTAPMTHSVFSILHSRSNRLSMLRGTRTSSAPTPLLPPALLLSRRVVKVDDVSDLLLDAAPPSPLARHRAQFNVIINHSLIPVRGFSQLFVGAS